MRTAEPLLGDFAVDSIGDSVPAVQHLIRKILKTGRVAESLPPPAARSTPPLPTWLAGGSLQLRHVDGGSCNGCEIEIGSSFGPVYDAERLGIRLVASPRHADGLMVTGPVTHNMVGPLQKTLEATPGPKIVIAVGDCALDCGAFRDGYGVAGTVADFVPVDVEIPGCPPDPSAIVAALRGLIG